MPKKLTDTEIYDEYTRDTCDAVSKPKPLEPKPTPEPKGGQEDFRRWLAVASEEEIDAWIGAKNVKYERMKQCFDACAGLDPKHIQELVAAVESLKGWAPDADAVGYTLDAFDDVWGALSKLKGDQ